MTQQARNSGSSRFLNKNSAYIESLVSFILDTKPYHSKLTEIIEEYHFKENVNVKIDERLVWQNKADSHWLYNYYSNGKTEGHKTKINRLYSNLFNTTKMRVGGEEFDGETVKWEVTDLAGVPQVYSKKATDGLGVAQVKLKRDSGKILPLVQSLDWHQSLGAFQFFINRLYDGEKYSPTWQSGIFRVREDPNNPGSEIDIIDDIVKATRARDLDKSNPNSSINIITNLLLELREEVESYDRNLTPAEFEQFHEVYREIDVRLDILDEGKTLPRTYDSLIADINSTEKLKHIDTKKLYVALQGQTSSLFFGDFTDKSVVEGGLIYYPSVNDSILRVSNINIDVSTPIYEEWTLICISERTQQFNVHGTASGFVGSFLPGDTFESDPVGLLSFDTDAIGRAKTGHTISITPGNRIAIHPSAHMETWNVIKTNPIAYSRPILRSTEYGYITNRAGDMYTVDIIDPDMPEKSIYVLTYIGDGIFEMTNTDIPELKEHIPVDVLYEGDKFVFTIHTASHPYVIGDEYYLFVENELARLIDPGMYFGYDVDAYDNSNLGNPDKESDPRLSRLSEILGNRDPNAPATLEHIQFLFDTRFKEYELQHTVNEYSVHKRKYRATAVVDRDRPIYTTYKVPQLLGEVDGAVDLADPDPNAPVKYSMVNIHLEPDEVDIPDLRLYYADQFKITYSDDGFHNDIHEVPGVFGINEEVEHDGVSFKIHAVDGKPFIAVIAVEYEKTFIKDPITGEDSVVGVITDIVESGDILSFEVYNPPPKLTEDAYVIAQYTPHVHMHALPFFESLPANWVFSVLDNSAYTLKGYKDNGTVLLETSGTLSLNNIGESEGYSIHAFNMAFSIDPNAGLHPGDHFTFTTYNNKPSYLVHGSITGFTEPAYVGKWYWNGKIGFKIDNPRYMIYDEEAKVIRNTPVKIKYLNPNHRRTIYTIRRLPGVSNRLLVTSDYNDIVGHVDEQGKFKDVNIEFDVSYESWGDREYVRVLIIEPNLEMFHGHDAVILKSKHPAYTAKNGNDFWITKTTDSALRLTIQAKTELLTDIYPVAIPFVGYKDIQYKNSPELRFPDNWIPMIRTARDSNTSQAEYYDPATQYVYHSATTGELIGTIDSLDKTKLSETVYFTWNPVFFGKYLPINSSVNLLTVNQGYSEKVKVHITESAKMMIRPGPYIDDVSDSDDVDTTITDHAVKYVQMTSTDQPRLKIEDDMLNGYVVGYGNNGYNDYDLEGLTEEERDALLDLYDEGHPIDIFSLLQKFNLTEEERTSIIERWQIYLFNENSDNPTEQPPVTKEQWEFFAKMVREDPAPGTRLVDQFGIPNRGAGFDITSKPNATARTSVQDAMDQVQFFTRAGTLPGIQVPTTEVYLNGSVPTVLPDVGETWESHSGLITCVRPSNKIVITMSAYSSVSVSARVWLKNEDSPQTVNLERLSPIKYSLDIPTAAVVKIDLIKT